VASRGGEPPQGKKLVRRRAAGGRGRPHISAEGDRGRQQVPLGRGARLRGLGEA
jgi:hypothetical protein